MREFCLLCTLKHLGQAHVLMDEAMLGYPSHKWLAIGHLAEAESECLRCCYTLARTIRRHRIQYEETNECDIMSLINLVNSKMLEMEHEGKTNKKRK